MPCVCIFGNPATADFVYDRPLLLATASSPRPDCGICVLASYACQPTQVFGSQKTANVQIHFAWQQVASKPSKSWQPEGEERRLRRSVRRRRADAERDAFRERYPVDDLTGHLDH